MSEPTVSERAPSSQEAARRFFDRWARFYGADPCSRWIRRAHGKALTALQLDESDRLLDVGCGPGAAVCEAAPLVARATGLDLSPAMVARAQAGAAALALTVDTASGTMKATRVLACFGNVPDDVRAL